MNKSEGSIILLNGVSSSGKSAIINELIKLNTSLKVLKIDDWFPDALIQKAISLGWQEKSGLNPWFYLHEHAYKTTQQYYFDTELRHLLFNETTDFYQKAKAISLQGHNVIIDTVLEYEKEYDTFNSFFIENKLLRVLIYCPMNVLLERVEKRNKSGIAEEYRNAFQSFEQFPAMFKPRENSSENIVDMVESEILKEALEKSIQRLIDNKIPDPYLPKLHAFKNDFIRKFKLDEQKEIALVTQHKYDLVLNSSLSSPHESAKKILKLID
jgi:chloramphenicol 3-O-phosphotransferase